MDGIVCGGQGSCTQGTQGHVTILIHLIPSRSTLLDVLTPGSQSTLLARQSAAAIINQLSQNGRGVSACSFGWGF